jgi:hypothetical protein
MGYRVPKRRKPAEYTKENFTPEAAERVIRFHGLFTEEQYHQPDTICDMTMKLSQYEYSGKDENTLIFLDFCKLRDIAISVRGHWYAIITDGTQQVSHVQRAYVACVLRNDYLNAKSGSLTGAKLSNAVEQFMRAIHFAATMYFIHNRSRATEKMQRIKAGEAIRG